MTDTPTKEKYPSWLWFAALFVFSGLLYLPSLGNQFINYDDPQILTENAIVQNLQIKTIITQPIATDYIPVTHIILGLITRVFGLVPQPFHAFNALVHALNACLVMLLCFSLARRREFSPLPISLACGFLFAAHPLHVESVAWVAEIKDVLSALFLLLALIAYDRKNLVSCFVCYVFSLLSKQMAVTLPFLLLLMDWYDDRPLIRNRRVIWKPILEKVPFLLLSVGFGIFRIWTDRTDTLVKPEPFSLLSGISNGFQSLVFYIGKTLFPFKLAAVYEIGFAHLEWSDFAGTVLFIALILWSVRRDRRLAKPAIFGCAFFLISASVILKFLPFGNNFKYADRYHYVPSIGLFFALAVCTQSLISSASSIAIKRALAAVVLVIVPLSCTWATVKREKTWKSSETLWLDVLDKYPGPIGFNNLGTYYTDVAPNYPMAEKWLKLAIEAQPDYSRAHYHLGNAYMRERAYDSAIAEFTRALSISPNFLQALHNMAYVYLQKHEYAKAEDLFLQVIQTNNAIPFAYQDLAECYIGEDRMAEAEKALNNALALDPNLPVALSDLALVYVKTSREAASLDLISKALNMRRNNPEIFKTAGQIFEKLNRLTEAHDAYVEALKLDVLSSDVREKLIRFDLAHGALDEARELVAQSQILDIKIDPELIKRAKSRK